MVNPKRWATWVHLQWHEDELAKQKKMEQEAAMAEQQMPGQMEVGAEKRSPQSAASPLKTEMQPKKSGIISSNSK